MPSTRALRTLTTLIRFQTVIPSENCVLKTQSQCLENSPRNFTTSFRQYSEGGGIGPNCSLLLQEGVSGRGAPHYHILLWMESAPIAGKDESKEALRRIQNRITWRIPEEDSNRSCISWSQSTSATTAVDTASEEKRLKALTPTVGLALHVQRVKVPL